MVKKYYQVTVNILITQQEKVFSLIYFKKKKPVLC